MKDRVLRKKYWAYLIPSICSQVIFTAYIVVDGIFVARGVSEAALAAVNIASPFVCLLWAISLSFASGTSATAARLMGEGKLDEARKLFSRNVCAMVIMGLCIALLVMIFMNPFCRLLGATDSTAEFLKSYLKGIAPFSVFFLLSYTLEILTATDGYPMIATRNCSISVIANIALDYLFIFVWGKGVWGAAIATSISQIMVICLYIIHFTSKKAHIKFCRFGSLKGSIKSMLKGLPSGMNDLSGGLINFIFVHEIMKFLGEQELVAYSVSQYTFLLLIVMALGVAQGAQPLISFANGRGDKAAISTIMRYEARTALCLEAVTAAVLTLLAEPIVRIFLKEDIATISYSCYIMKCLLASCIIAGLNLVIAGYFTAMEKPIQGGIISMARCTIMAFVGIEIAGHVLGPDGIWWGMCFSEILTLLIAAVLFARDKKKRAEESEKSSENSQ